MRSWCRIKVESGGRAKVEEARDRLLDAASRRPFKVVEEEERMERMEREGRLYGHHGRERR